MDNSAAISVVNKHKNCVIELQNRLNQDFLQAKNFTEDDEEQTYYNEIYIAGSNKFGQIGLSHKHPKKNFPLHRYCHFHTIFKQVTCGAQFSAFLSNDGYIYTNGCNIHGSLGVAQEKLTYSYQPRLVERLSSENVVQIASGSYHSLALTSDGRVFSWGKNSEGQLGIGSTQSQFAPQQVHYQQVTDQQIDISPELKGAKTVVCGANHSFIITKYRQQVYCFGNCLYGQLGLGSSCQSIQQPEHLTFFQNRRIMEISAGLSHTLFLEQFEKTVYATGDNTQGQCGLGQNKKFSLTPICLENHLYFEKKNVKHIAAGRFSAALTEEDGAVYYWGPTPEGRLMEPKKMKQTLESFAEVKIGMGESALLLTINGSLYSWGKNQYGECGLGDLCEHPEIVPVNFMKGREIQCFDVGEAHTVILGKKIMSKKTTRVSTYRSKSSCSGNTDTNFLEDQIINGISQTKKPIKELLNNLIDQSVSTEERININYQENESNRDESFMNCKNILSENMINSQILLNKSKFFGKIRRNKILQVSGSNIQQTCTPLRNRFSQQSESDNDSSQCQLNYILKNSNCYTRQLVYNQSQAEQQFQVVNDITDRNHDIELSRELKNTEKILSQKNSLTNTSNFVYVEKDDNILRSHANQKDFTNSNIEHSTNHMSLQQQIALRENSNENLDLIPQLNLIQNGNDEAPNQQINPNEDRTISLLEKGKILIDQQENRKSSQLIPSIHQSFDKKQTNKDNDQTTQDNDSSLSSKEALTNNNKEELNNLSNVIAKGGIQDNYNKDLGRILCISDKENIYNQKNQQNQLIQNNPKNDIVDIMIWQKQKLVLEENVKKVNILLSQREKEVSSLQGQLVQKDIAIYQLDKNNKQLKQQNNSKDEEIKLLKITISKLKSLCMASSQKNPFLSSQDLKEIAYEEQVQQ